MDVHTHTGCSACELESSVGSTTRQCGLWACLPPDPEGGGLCSLQGRERVQLENQASPCPCPWNPRPRHRHGGPQGQGLLHGWACPAPAVSPVPLLTGHSLASEACRPGFKAGQVAQAPCTSLAVRDDSDTTSSIGPCPWFPSPPLTSWSGGWVAVPHRPQELCSSRPRFLHPHRAGLQWINGPEPWLGRLALVLCGLWPRTPWASRRSRTAPGLSTDKQEVESARPTLPAPPRGHPGGRQAGAGDLSSPLGPSPGDGPAWLQPPSQEHERGAED